MHLLYQRIERHLEESTLGALPMGELVRRLQQDPSGPHVDLRTIMAEMERWPDKFRMVNPWDGGSAALTPQPTLVREVGSRGRERASGGPDAGGVWAVLMSAVLADPVRTPLRERPRQVAGLVRESVLHLARALDARSNRARARWTRIAGSGTETGGRLRPV